MGIKFFYSFFILFLFPGLGGSALRPEILLYVQYLAGCRESNPSWSIEKTSSLSQFLLSWSAQVMIVLQNRKREKATCRRWLLPWAPRSNAEQLRIHNRVRAHEMKETATKTPCLALHEYLASMSSTVRKVLADFGVFDWRLFFKSLSDVKFRQIEGNSRKIRHIELSYSVINKIFLTVHNGNNENLTKHRTIQATVSG